MCKDCSNGPSCEEDQKPVIGLKNSNFQTSPTNGSSSSSDCDDDEDPPPQEKHDSGFNNSENSRHEFGDK